MSEPNYNETVIIPLLQKKYQELTNSNLYLEASLLVEQAKNKHSEDKLKNIENEFNLKFSKLEDEKTLLNRTFNEISNSKNNEIGEKSQHLIQLQSKIEELTRLSSEQANIISVNRNSIREQQTVINDLNNQLNTLKFQLEEGRSRPSNKKKKKEEDILDGDSY